MQILLVADCHGKLMQRDIDHEINKNGVPDVVFLLGDNAVCDIEALKYNENLDGVPMYGILGNHDRLNVLWESNVPDLHLTVTEIGGYSVGGFGGSLRYKNDSSYPLWTNEESSKLLSDFKRCDIFLSHSNPYKDSDLEDYAHSGLLGITEYIHRCKPRYVYHGHLHDNFSYTLDETTVTCVDRLKTVILD